MLTSPVWSIGDVKQGTDFPQQSHREKISLQALTHYL